MATASNYYKVPDLAEAGYEELLILANYEGAFDINTTKLTTYLGAMTKKAIITDVTSLENDANSASLLSAFKSDPGFGRFRTENNEPVELQGASFPKKYLLAVYLQLKKDGENKYNTVNNVVGGENKEKINPINRIYVYDDSGKQISKKYDNPSNKTGSTVVTDQYYRINITANVLKIFEPGEDGIEITKTIVGELSYTLSKLLKALLEVELEYGGSIIGEPEDTRKPGERVVGGKKSKKHRKKGGKKSQKRRSMRRLKRSRARK